MASKKKKLLVPAPRLGCKGGTAKCRPPCSTCYTSDNEPDTTVTVLGNDVVLDREPLSLRMELLDSGSVNFELVLDGEGWQEMTIPRELLPHMANVLLWFSGTSSAQRDSWMGWLQSQGLGTIEPADGTKR